MSTEDERAAFEVWAKREHGDDEFLEKFPSGRYKSAVMAFQWSAWQARAAHRPVEPKEGV